MTPFVKPRVLIASAHSNALLAYDLVLGGDYSVFLAETPEEALDLAGRADFLVILLAVDLPGLNGYETAMELRKRARTRLTPIVFLAPSDANPAQALRGFDAGGTDYLFTPLSPEFLKHKVDTYARRELRNQELRHQLRRVTELIQSFHRELAKVAGVDAALEARIQELERLSEEIRREAAPNPSPSC